MPLAFSILLAKVLILVRTCIIFRLKLKDAFNTFNTFGKSINFDKEVCEFLAKVVILVGRSDILTKNISFVKEV